MIVISITATTEEIRSKIVEKIRDFNKLNGEPEDKGVPKEIGTMTREAIIQFAMEEEWAEFENADGEQLTTDGRWIKE
jgi:hypothetical protein